MRPRLIQFKVLSASERPAFADHAVSFTSLTMEVGDYLRHLVHQFTQLGGTCLRRTLSHIHETLEYDPQAIIVCCGIGARNLGGVEDSDMYPMRGQVVVIDAPWCRNGWTRQVGSLDGGEGGERTYVIPRKSGRVVIGGTREQDDWHVSPLDASFLS
jgi:D-amino-acid oxidase